jgi:hypothetical protein
MPLALVLTLALTAQAPADNPADLAGRVASADPAAREEAEGRLEEMGRAALPALRIAAEKAEDPVAGRRLADLIDLIERRRLLRATPVALDLKDVPVAEAVAALSRDSGLRVALDPPDDPAWAQARITLGTRGPIGFWEAIDRLGAAGGFRVEPASFWANSPKDVPAVRLLRGEGSPVRPSYAGPYRVELTSLDRHRQVARPREGRLPKVVDGLTAAVQLVAEPGILVDRNGSPRVLEALDDRGADLRPPSARDPSSPRMAFSLRQWQPMLDVEAYRVPLGIPASRGGTLKRLRGVLPIIAYARTGPLVSVPLGAAVNRPLSASGVTLTVRRLDRAGFVWSLQAVVRGEAHTTTPTTAAGPRQLTLAPVRPPFHPDDHVQVLDDQGRPFLVSTGGNTPRPDGSIEFTLLIHSNAQYGPPTTLRYYGLVAEATEMPFTFEDVPMP